MAKKSPLEDAATSTHAWTRYKRIMRYLGLMTLGIIALACVVVYRSGEPVSIHFYIALALGFGFTVMLTGALMGLIFLSSGTGHDESVEDPSDTDPVRPKRRERGPFG